MDGQKISFSNGLMVAVFAFIPCMFAIMGLLIATGLVVADHKPEPAGLIFTAAGLFFLSLVGYKSLTLDRISRKITGATNSIISRKSTIIDFSEVSSVEFRWERGGRGRRFGVLAFKRADGQEALFGEVVSNENDAKKVADFLGVPFSYKPPASLFEAIQRGQEELSGVRQIAPKQGAKSV